jgi:hypothetical protein
MGKGHRALIEPVEARKLLASVSGTAWNDLNNDGVKQTREKWFSLDETTAASITIYGDLNGDGKFDTGEPSATLTKEGSYKLTIPRTGPLAIRTTYAIDTKKQKSAVYGSVPVVVFATADQAITNTNVPLQKGTIVTGAYFVDENANDVVDAGEVKKDRAHVYYDANKDGVRQIEEPFTQVSAPFGSADYKFQIPVPAGEGQLVLHRWDTDPLTVEPITFNAVVGTHLTKNFAVVPEMVLQGRLFNDLNGNGKRNKGEPWVAGVRAWFDYNQDNKWDKLTEPSASTDAGGNYRLVSHKSSAIYGVNLRFRSSPENVLTSTTNLPRIIFKTLKETQSYNHGFKTASISMQVFNDTVLQYMVVYLDLNGDGKQGKTEPSVITDSNGIAKFENLATTPSPKKYKIVVRYSSKFVKTYDKTFTEVTLDPFESESVNYGVRRLA